MPGRHAGAGAELRCPVCQRSFDDGGACPVDGAALVLAPRRAIEDPLVGRVIEERFTLGALLGRGAMGSVYRATQHSIDRPVAIKIVDARRIDDERLLKRFLREARLSSRLSHPNAVSVVDFGRTRDRLYFMVMELIEGEPLDRVLAREGALPVARAILIARQICAALAKAHAMGIVHRDLKPGNVMVLAGEAGDERVKVLDFGIAKWATELDGDLTQAGELLGTPSYMSPEAALGGEITARTDLYSLGVMLYEMVSGRQPFVERTIRDLLALQVNQPPPPLIGAPPELSALVEGLLAKDPAARPADAAAVRDALGRIAGAARDDRRSPLAAAGFETAVDATVEDVAPVRSAPADEAGTLRGGETADTTVNQAPPSAPLDPDELQTAISPPPVAAASPLAVPVAAPAAAPAPTVVSGLANRFAALGPRGLLAVVGGLAVAVAVAIAIAVAGSDDRAPRPSVPASAPPTWIDAGPSVDAAPIATPPVGAPRSKRRPSTRTRGERSR